MSNFENETNVSSTCSSAEQSDGVPTDAQSCGPRVTTLDYEPIDEATLTSEQKHAWHVGIDVGSTTVKIAILDDNAQVRHARYERHHADVRATITEVISEAAILFPDQPMTIAITGSGGLLLAQWLGIDFVQEVIASKTAVEALIPETDVVIELGGEDAKIIYFDNGIEQRMNGTCAGGTGAFIDQMAALLDTDATGLNELAKNYTTIHPIASRCGVFAKTDVQPLLNEGARKEDIAASIFQAVVTQTISGLACGRPIRGTVAFLGGPLQYLSELDKRFCETLELDDDHAIRPKDAHLFVASGAAMSSKKSKPELLPDVLRRLQSIKDVQGSEVTRLPALFETEAEYKEFKDRHDKERVRRGDLQSYRGGAYLGIDAGSTTFKSALIGRDGELLWSHYASNKGEVLDTARGVITEMYKALPRDEKTGEPLIHIAHATVTGYGEAMLLTALSIDSGEIETVAHLRGAQEMLPGVEFILDIGGQDMKCLRVKDGVIEHILLNEACSSGCGSFIETFAAGLNLNVKDFAGTANAAKSPVDLGSKCTVFMNSRVKQAQKEGAAVGDIAAGLALAVVKNALFKVIKIRDPKELGTKLIVQGGTFLNDSVLRAFEQLAEAPAVRPDIAGLMGAYGAALLARDRAKSENDQSSLLSIPEIEALNPTQKHVHCKACPNTCLMTISDFGKDPETGKRRRFITGNRCEKGIGSVKGNNQVPNVFEYKNHRLFDYIPLSEEEAFRGTIGIPRALNIYENFPFWFTFFTKLGYRVLISDNTNADTYELGIESMPSESVCYPAKLSHGHVMNLLEKKPDFIFMPCSKFERQEDMGANNHFNCPIVASYPEALRLNIDELDGHETLFLDPWLPYDQKDHLKTRLRIELFENEHAASATCRHAAAPTQAEIDEAVELAWAEDAVFKNDIRAKGEEVLNWMTETGTHGIVLSGRPYHNDPEINHAIPELLTSFGLAVLTEDSIAHLGTLERPIRLVDQWMYHTRLYAAAKVCTQRDDLDLIQLVSFGCGLDALTVDQVQEILESSGKIYTELKIDQVSNLGAVRIRIRSLLAALKDQADKREEARQDKIIAELQAAQAKQDLDTIDDTKENPVFKPKALADVPTISDDKLASLRPKGAGEGRPSGVVALQDAQERAQEELTDEQAHEVVEAAHQQFMHHGAETTMWKKVPFTQEMKDAGYTILSPQMAPIHFELLAEVFHRYGYNLEVLPSVDNKATEAGLRYVNNDICYPSILVTGQIIAAIESGKYDTDKLAVIITQTGGGCRATNYISLIRKALKAKGLEHIPVISLAFKKLDEYNPGFKVTLPMLYQAIYALYYGDLLMQCLYRTRPYEAQEGAAHGLFRHWMDECKDQLLNKGVNYRLYKKTSREIVESFDVLPTIDFDSKPRVGVVGEILVKFHPTANNQLVETIEREGCEAVVPGLVEFFLFAISGSVFQADPLGRSKKKAFFSKIALKALWRLRKPMNDALAASERFEPATDVFELATYAEEILSLCNSMGEGWLLTAEMIELIRTGAPNIVCAQPFGCLPNHVVGKAVIKELRRRYTDSNVVAVDYDPGASEVNQLNRIKLMISVAKANREEADALVRAKNVENVYTSEEMLLTEPANGVKSCSAFDEEDEIAEQVREAMLEFDKEQAQIDLRSKVQETQEVSVR